MADMRYMACYAAQSRLRPLHALLCSAALSGIGIAAALAGQASTLLPISVVIPTRISLALQAPSRLMISEEDIRRGYVDIAEPMLISIESNSPQGVMLDLRAAGDLFTGLEFFADGTVTRMPGDGGMITLRWPTASSQEKHTLACRWRFVLRAGVSAGNYPWPLHVAAQPLDALLAARNAP